MINPFLAEKLPEVQSLFQTYKIKRAFAFGSVVTEKLIVEIELRIKNYFKMINPFLAEKLPEVQRLFQTYKIKRAFAFGSVVTEKFTNNSDVDFLVSFENEPDPLIRGERWWDLYFKLQDLFNCNIDLVTEESLKNPYLIESINANKVQIYGN